MRRQIGIGLVGAVIAAGVGHASGQDGRIALTNVHVIDVERGEVVRDQTIVISTDLIVSVGDATGDIQAELVIDGAGRYALPGLIDSHVHYVAPEVFDPMFVAYGVALVRDLGSPTEQVIALRDSMGAGVRLAPRMICTGAIVDGNPPVWPFSEACETPAEGREAVRKLAAAGVNQIKVYSRLEPEVYRAICDEARDLGLMPVGHVPLGVDVHEVIETGHATIEHLTGFDGLIADRLMPDQTNRMDYLARQQAWAMMDALSDDDLAEIVAPFGEARVAQVPTLAVMEGIASFASAADDPMYRFAPASMKGFWESGNYAAWGEQLVPQIPGMKRMVGALHDAGAPIIAGTDLANPNVIAGYSLHKELEYLVESGLSEAEAIRAATVTPAALFGLEGLGAIAEGHEATLLLLSANPLESIEATRSIEAVVYRGQHLDRNALDALLAEAEGAAGAAPEEPDSGEFDITRVEMEGEPVVSGTTKMDFGGFDAGAESFRITKVDDGYRIVAHNVPKGGMQPAFVLEYETDADRRFTRAEYRPLNGADPATYWREGDALHARSGDEEMTLELPEGATVSGAAMVTDFGVLHGLGLEVGEVHSGKAVSFGMPTWRWAMVDSTITRLPDATFEGPDGPVETRVFRQVMTIEGMGDFTFTSHVDKRGVTVGAEVVMAFGKLTTKLHPLGEQ